MTVAPDLTLGLVVECSGLTNCMQGTKGRVVAMYILMFLQLEILRDLIIAYPVWSYSDPKWDKWKLVQIALSLIVVTKFYPTVDFFAMLKLIPIPSYSLSVMNIRL